MKVARKQEQTDREKAIEFLEKELSKIQKITGELNNLQEEIVNELSRLRDKHN